MTAKGYGFSPGESIVWVKCSAIGCPMGEDFK